ncbi:MAG TPA: aldo/keto reductase [Actinomycetota bacterium]|nr:aldo/keto reductase [Actinomycetota bacterium]
MRERQLGSQGPSITVVGFGAWEAGGDAWGPNASEASVIRAMRAAIDAGMSWIDTAEVYGKGVSETIVGKAVADRRGDILLFTKVGPSPEGTGFRPEEVRRAAEGSLGRLGTDVLDLYQLHWPDGSGVPIEETWGAMAELVQAGKVRWIGVSNFDRDLIERCRAIRHVDSLQQDFSPVVTEDRELLRWCGEVGTGVLSYSPLGAGLLTGRYAREDLAAIDDWRRGELLQDADHVERVFALVEAMRPLAERLGVSLAQLVLAWNVHQPGVTGAIAGSRDADHVRANAEAGEIELDARTLSELDELVFGP